MFFFEQNFYFRERKELLEGVRLLFWCRFDNDEAKELRVELPF